MKLVPPLARIGATRKAAANVNAHIAAVTIIILPNCIGLRCRSGVLGESSSSQRGLPFIAVPMSARSSVLAACLFHAAYAARREVIAFRCTSYGCAHAHQCIQSNWNRTYNWSTITTVISFTHTNMSELCSVARAHGARVIIKPRTRLDTARLADRSWITNWINNVTVEVANFSSMGVMGANLDVESFHNTSAATKGLFTRAICDLSTALRARNLSLHSLDTAIWGYTEFFDLVALAKCAEFLLPMAYDMVEKNGRASSNSPWPDIVSGLQKNYVDAGVPTRQVVLALPLYGYSFPCLGGATDTAGPLAGTAAPECKLPVRVPSGTWQVGAGSILERLAQPGVATHIGRDNVSLSPYFEYTERAHAPLGRRQVWWEDAVSIRKKAGLAHTMDLGGVATWTADALWNAPKGAAQPFWTALADGTREPSG